MQTQQAALSKKSAYETKKTIGGLAVNQAEIESTLKIWANNLVAISKAYRAGLDYTRTARELINNTYNYENGPVLFKPTLASEHAFRTTYEGAVSYFIGGNPAYSEDRGFALNNWESVDFELAGFILGENHGIVMGNKKLKDATGKITIANFTMGFVRDSSGQLKINLHHSSLPFVAN